MLEIGIALSSGVKRKDRPNQDAVFVLTPGRLLNRERPHLVIVADGMGGYGGGARASQLVIQTLQRYYKRHWRDRLNSALLAEAAKAAHTQIRKQGRKQDELASMGSTVVAFAVQEDTETAFLVNVGDSRAYHINTEGIRLVSHDHSKVAELVRQGQITWEQARTHPQKNVLDMSLNARRTPEEVQPYHAAVPFKPGDLLLLCSDGLWGPIQEAVLQAVAMELPPQAAADKLTSIANAQGGPDNISAVIVRRAGEHHMAAEASLADDTNPGLAQ